MEYNMRVLQDSMEAAAWQLQSSFTLKYYAGVT